MTNRMLRAPAARTPALLAALTLCIAHGASASTITVNSSADTSANDGHCTLREAIAAANNNVASGGLAGECVAGQTLPTIDTIAFAIPGAGLHTIVPASNLPMISQPVMIDGYTQPTASVNTLAIGDNAVLRIQIDGTNLTTPIISLGGPFNGDSSGTTIRGLVLGPNPRASAIEDGGPFGGGANNITIKGNFIGADATGLVSISSAGFDAIHCVSGNGRIIGGSAPADRNILVAGSGTPIDINNCSNAIIQGNYIGVDASGTVMLGNAFQGIFMTQGANNNLIGGTSPGAGNVIAAASVGINLSEGADGTTIQGNDIGTDATGAASFGTTFGISIESCANVTVGGSAPGAGNVLSGNAFGIQIGATTGTVVQGNHIGTGADGIAPIPNGVNGIELTSSSSGLIGGTNPGEGNVIANSCQQGVAFHNNPTGWSILGNSIHSNSGIGISLIPSIGPTPNDAGDADTGPNNLQNYPVLTLASVSGGIATISGTLNSIASKQYRLEFFASVDCHKSGFGEGQTLLGFANVSTDASGNASFGPLLFSGAPNNQTAYAATATDPNGNTSEFSMCIGGIGRIFASGFEPQCGN